jgi:hypothetical protein
VLVHAAGTFSGDVEMTILSLPTNRLTGLKPEHLEPVAQPQVGCVGLIEFASDDRGVVSLATSHKYYASGATLSRGAPGIDHDTWPLVLARAQPHAIR